MSTSDDDTFSELARRADELTLKNRAMDEAPIGITIADLEGEDQPIVYANAGFERITGYARKDILDRNCRFLQGPGTEEQSVDRMREAIDARESVQVELRNYRKDGTQFWNEVTLAPIRTSGGPVRYYVGFQQDITERKTYEMRLEKQRDDLALLNQLVRHDIRNDLQLVLALGEVLRDHVDEEGLDHLDSVLDSADHAVDLTETARDMAEYVVREDGDLQAVSLPDRLHEQLHDARSSFPDATFDVDGSIPSVRVTASDLLGSVFGNLLRNAVLHHDGEAHVQVAVEEDSETAVVRIADDGPGIPEDKKESIFGRGEKGPRSEGTGIGLYLVGTLVDDFGGDVRVEDNDPRGAVFVIELPVAEATA